MEIFVVRWDKVIFKYFVILPQFLGFFDASFDAAYDIVWVN